MTYRFKLQEPVADGVRRIGLEQVEIAAAKLASKDDIPAAIHDARRCLKRLRALLRLIRPGLESRFGAIADGGCDRLRKILARGQATTLRAGADGRRQALLQLEEARRLFTGRAGAKIELEHVVEGLEAAYRKARKAFRHSYKEPSDETFRYAV